MSLVRVLSFAAASAFVVGGVGVQASPASSQPVADDRATKDDYALDTSATTAKLKVGEDGMFSVRITPKNGKKVHEQAPLELSFVDNGFVKPGKPKLGRADVKKNGAKEPEVATTLRALKAGTTTLEANISFFLCTEAWCQRMSDRVQVSVVVE
ncbi:MAG: hypothetical protein FJ137_23680 [Deltaproteobacteria bacterium]|nr:hypothetical protein [Deltaproteobacteria bacterium]